jgi:hypothetical protein
MESTRIGIIGSGDVAKALANGFIKNNYSVLLGTRSVEKLKDWKNQAGAKGNVGSVSEAAAYSDILVLAVKGSAAVSTVKSIGAKSIVGKTIIDTTNPIADAPPDNGVLRFFTTLDKSLMEQLQATAPDAHFVKAFNCIGSAHMVHPDFAGGKPSMFICGNRDEAKNRVAAIVELFGFEVEDMGKAEAARAIEPLCMLWCIPGLLRNDWSHAFRLLKQKNQQ